MALSADVPACCGPARPPALYPGFPGVDGVDDRGLSCGTSLDRAGSSRTRSRSCISTNIADCCRGSEWISHGRPRRRHVEHARPATDNRRDLFGPADLQAAIRTALPPCAAGYGTMARLLDRGGDRRDFGCRIMRRVRLRGMAG